MLLLVAGVVRRVGERDRRRGKDARPALAAVKCAGMECATPHTRLFFCPTHSASDGGPPTTRVGRGQIRDVGLAGG